MTTTIGVRELKNQASRILRQVRELGVEEQLQRGGAVVTTRQP